MMGLEFAQYQPAEWVANGLLTTFARKAHEVPKRLARVGKWSVGAAVIAFALNAVAEAPSFVKLPTQVVEIDALVIGSTRTRLRPEDHLVPPGYWEKLGAAIRSVERLPAQDLSRDPPVMV
jgi:hypothetical protein